VTCPTCNGDLRFDGAYASRCSETGYRDEGDRYVCTGCGEEFSREELDEMADAKPSDGAMRAAERILRNIETYNALGGIRIAVPPVENVADLIDSEMRTAEGADQASPAPSFQEVA
jgi:hypothetical protein